MSRLSLWALPALAAAAASIRERTSLDLDGQQRPLHGDEVSLAHKLPSLKLNDGHEIPTVCCPWLLSRSKPSTNVTHDRSPTA